MTAIGLEMSWYGGRDGPAKRGIRISNRATGWTSNHLRSFNESDSSSMVAQSKAPSIAWVSLNASWIAVRIAGISSGGAKRGRNRGIRRARRCGGAMGEPGSRSCNEDVLIDGVVLRGGGGSGPAGVCDVRAGSGFAPDDVIDVDSRDGVDGCWGIELPSSEDKIISVFSGSMFGGIIGAGSVL